MNIIFHYDAGPWLDGQLQALAADGLMVSTCGEADEARFLALLPHTSEHIRIAVQHGLRDVPTR